MPRSDEASATIDRYLGALAAQDWSVLAACLAEDVERIGPYGDVYHGRAAYAAFLERTLAGLSGYVLAVERVIAAGRVVVVELSETVDVPDGRRRTNEAVVFDVDADGLIRRVAVYLRKAVLVGP